MPKNQFQRPLPVTRGSKVPRHGAPSPASKAEPRQLAPQRQDRLTLPSSLEALLGRPASR